MPSPPLSRRHVLTSLGAVAGGVLIGLATPVTAAHAAPKRTKWAGRSTQNRWPVIAAGSTERCPIEGSDAAVTLASDAGVQAVLLHVARRFHYEIAALNPGDVVGHTTNTGVVVAYESNRLSGTALTIRPGHYPAGSSGNLYPTETSVLRDILADCDGVVRWGGDDRDHPSEGFFQIDVPPGDAHLGRISAAIRETQGPWRGRP